MPAFRSVVTVLVSFVVRSFSTNSRPALRAASGRPPAGSAAAATGAGPTLAPGGSASCGLTCQSRPSMLS
jgi:hypothetical protein